MSFLASVRPRFTEKGNLEVLLFTIQSKMRANNQKVYMPREGKLITDINKVGSCPPGPYSSGWGSSSQTLLPAQEPALSLL